MDDDVIELTEDGVFEIPTPKNAVKIEPKAEDHEAEQAYPAVVAAAAPSSDVLGEIAEGEYKVFHDEAAKQLHIVIHVAKEEGEAQKVIKKGSVLTVVTTSGCEIPINLQNLPNVTANASACSARRHQQFLVVLMPVSP